MSFQKIAITSECVIMKRYTLKTVLVVYFYGKDIQKAQNLYYCAISM